MTYTLIKGAFRITGTSPDGDTIRFRPDVTQLVDGLGPDGQVPDWKLGRTEVNIRFEGIDALETSFQGTRQDSHFGDAATARMLALAGFETVQRDSIGRLIESATPPEMRGFILAKNLDSFGRVIAFVYAGTTGRTDGAFVEVDVSVMISSFNATLLQEGLVYPALYTTLPVPLRNDLAAITRFARDRRLGLWPTATAGVDAPASVPDLAAAEVLVMWPKLFRRLSSYFRQGNVGLAEFEAWLREDVRDRDDPVLLPGGVEGNLHDVFEVNGDTIRMTVQPEEVVIAPDNVNSLVSEVVIVAALVNATGRDEGAETVTIINTAASPVDLTGWQIRDRQVQESNGAGNALTGTLDAGSCRRIAVAPPVRFGNGGDDIVLVDASGNVIHRVTYTADQGQRAGVTVVF